MRTIKLSLRHKDEHHIFFGPSDEKGRVAIFDAVSGAVDAGLLPPSATAFALEALYGQRKSAQVVRRLEEDASGL